MLQRTHGAAGVLAAEWVLHVYEVPLLSWETAGALMLGCFAGPLADIDKPGSVMAKLFFPLSALLRLLQIHHRTLTHSFAFLALLGMALMPLPPLYFWTFLLAYASHPLIDLLNEQGVALFWPVKKKVRLLPKFMAIDTGSPMESLFCFILVVLCFWLPIRDWWHGTF
ncbi:metal-dependent hydrolase [Paenibacillus filicis]|uniref:Metal-dependent hydrolase n=1 Tax=Paenibacillus gyeongsangnamensis TaxID=3388067 RepID=A0ABT4QH95_9BACL|nr:metal-dependent hydrolase [Paenibacillus filicis]MCZ8516267.1 metal-dependent hydrolase [Paenibacillus filicis]